MLRDPPNRPPANQKRGAGKMADAASGNDVDPPGAPSSPTRFVGEGGSDVDLPAGQNGSRLTTGEQFQPPPCFYFASCGRKAEVEKQGKSLCRKCADRLQGLPYPLRQPMRSPLYANARAMREALDMVETQAKEPK